VKEFCNEMDDDFNTPRALALMFEEVRLLNRLLDNDETKGLISRRADLLRVGEVLGFLQEGPAAFREKKKERWLRTHGLTAQEIEEKIRLRNLARSEKRWDEADRIRNELSEKGIALEDTPGGTLWKVR